MFYKQKSVKKQIISNIKKKKKIFFLMIRNCLDMIIKQQNALLSNHPLEKKHLIILSIIKNYKILYIIVYIYCFFSNG